jgi:hypothetical protein
VFEAGHDFRSDGAVTDQAQAGLVWSFHRYFV